MADAADIEAAMLDLVAKAGAGRTINPTEVARAVEPSPDWHRLMPLLRRVAVGLARSGRIVITRKGRPVDPDDFKGVYRLGLPPPQD